MKTRENQVQTIDIKEVKQEVVDKMEQYKQEFIEFMVESDVLKFGEFTLKSGRKSPFFMNAGAYVTGSQYLFPTPHTAVLSAKAVRSFPLSHPHVLRCSACGYFPIH